MRHSCLFRDMPKYFWWKREGKRQLGRTKLTWKFAVKMDLKEAVWVSEVG